MTSPMTVCLFGATGFVGRYIVKRLADSGHQVNVASRRPKEAIHLKTAGDVGQVALLPFKGIEDVPAIMQGADAAISLAGILYESRSGDFERIHHELPKTIARTATELGLDRMVHISAIGADPNSKSLYARSKAHGEAAVLEQFPNATILRPSIVFGPEDNFFNQFANMSRFAPALPLIAGGRTRFQPVYVDDVAHAAVEAIEKRGFEGRTFELGGPDIMSFEDCLRYILKHTGRHRPLITIPMGIARLQAAILEKLPVPPLTRDQLILLENDNLVSDSAETFDAFGIQPTPVDMIVPRYLRAHRIGDMPMPVA